jgi:hypothetical protein
MCAQPASVAETSPWNSSGPAPWYWCLHGTLGTTPSCEGGGPRARSSAPARTWGRTRSCAAQAPSNVVEHGVWSALPLSSVERGASMERAAAAPWVVPQRSGAGEGRRLLFVRRLRRHRPASRSTASHWQHTPRCTLRSQRQTLQPQSHSDARPRIEATLLRKATAGARRVAVAISSSTNARTISANVGAQRTHSAWQGWRWRAGGRGGAVPEVGVRVLAEPARLPAAHLAPARPRPPAATLRWRTGGRGGGAGCDGKGRALVTASPPSAAAATRPRARPRASAA